MRRNDLIDRRRPRIAISWTAPLLLTAACIGCAGRPLTGLDPAATATAATHTSGVRRAEEVKKGIASIAPVGTSLSHAEQIMRKEGFECSFAVDDEGRDVLRCVRHDGGALLLARRWTVEFPYRDGAVLEARVE